MSQIKLIIQFDGHKYFGWQSQKITELTIQDQVNNALAIIYKGPIKTVESGRTDAKVHSLSHSVVFKPLFDIEAKAIVKGLNSLLPEDIRVISCETVSDDFRPTNDAKIREYRYLFSNLDQPSAFQSHYIHNTTHKLNFDKMRQATRLFVGVHDFKSFHCKGSAPSSTIREIFLFDLEYCKVDMHGIFPSHHYFKIQGSGFLKQMVRLMVGSIFDVGRGKLELAQIADALELADGVHIAPVVSPEGLYKYNVAY